MKAKYLAVRSARQLQLYEQLPQLGDHPYLVHHSSSGEYDSLAHSTAAFAQARESGNLEFRRLPVQCSPTLALRSDALESSSSLSVTCQHEKRGIHLVSRPFYNRSGALLAGSLALATLILSSRDSKRRVRREGALSSFVLALGWQIVVLRGMN